MATLFWIGVVCASSFMEAGLTFCALGIGRLVFNALNKLEWEFCRCCYRYYSVSQSN